MKRNPFRSCDRKGWLVGRWPRQTRARAPASSSRPSPGTPPTRRRRSREHGGRHCSRWNSARPRWWSRAAGSAARPGSARRPWSAPGGVERAADSHAEGRGLEARRPPGGTPCIAVLFAVARRARAFAGTAHEYQTDPFHRPKAAFHERLATTLSPACPVCGFGRSVGMASCWGRRIRKVGGPISNLSHAVTSPLPATAWLALAPALSPTMRLNCPGRDTTRPSARPSFACQCLGDPFLRYT
jgi:hypothetical protein